MSTAKSGSCAIGKNDEELPAAEDATVTYGAMENGLFLTGDYYTPEELAALPDGEQHQYRWMRYADLSQVLLILDHMAGDVPTLLKDYAFQRSARGWRWSP
jgi:hypothetical protein